MTYTVDSNWLLRDVQFDDNWDAAVEASNRHIREYEARQREKRRAQDERRRARRLVAA
jgi:hypothetical protein